MLQPIQAKDIVMYLLLKSRHFLVIEIDCFGNWRIKFAKILKRFSFVLYSFNVNIFIIYSKLCHSNKAYGPPRWRSGRAFASHAGGRVSIPGRDRPKSLKQVVKAPCQTLGNRWECHGSSELTIIKVRPASQ